MKLKVTYTRQSNVDVDDLDFLTEWDYLNKIKQKATDFYNNRVAPGVQGAYTQASERARGIASDIATATSEGAQKAMGKLQNLLGGGGPSQVFQTIMDYLKGIPWLAHLGTRLRDLWGKIKKFGAKKPPVSKVKSLSIIAVSCIGFIAAMVASWTYRIIFGKKNIGYNRFKKSANKYKSQISSNWDNLKRKNESAVFIEELGEILREDKNGGTFAAMAKRAIEYSKDKIDALWYFCKNGKRRPDETFGSKINGYFQKLIDFIKQIIDYVRTILGDAATAIKKRFKRESAVDDSLPALYESIIWEAQAHKVKEIKKKARKKVAIKKARSKKALRGRV